MLPSFLKEKGKRLERDFFERETEKVALGLLGKYLFVSRGSKEKVVKIQEVEAYLGPEDKASHARFGKTRRNFLMWQKGGLLYIYLVYGMHYCLNITTEKEGKAGAVLIRRAEPIFGVKGKLDGPGKLTRALGISKKENGLDLVKSKVVFLKDFAERPSPVYSAPRVGIDYAKEWKEKLLRFYY